jgi:predicted  nucleic acid-binding Zn-ribbon protein
VSEVSFEQFIVLVEFDQATNKLEKEKTELQQQTVLYTTTLAELSSRLEASEAQLRRAKLTVKEKEAHMKELDVRQKEKQQQLDRVTNQREYTYTSSEIEKLKKAQHDYEPELIEAWNALEGATRDTKVVQQEITQKIEELRAQLKQKNEAIETLSKQIADRMQKRNNLLHGVPPDLLEKYDAMHARVANPIVPVAHDSCSACFNTVSQSMLSRLRMRVLEQCKGCFRFMYLSRS